MRGRLAVAAAMAIGAGLFGRPAHAQNLERPCTVGQRVVDPVLGPGTVASVDHSTCSVAFDKGEKHFREFYMLAPAQPMRMSAQLTPGVYECFGGLPIRYMSMNLVILGPTSYRDQSWRAGAYRYDNGSNLLSFASGPFRGYYAKRVGTEKVGLADKPTGFFAITCDRKR